MVLGDLLRAPLYCALDSTTWRSRFVQGGCSKELSVFADEDGHQMLNQGSAYEKETGKVGRVSYGSDTGCPFLQGTFTWV